MKFDDRGRELPDDTPVAMPVGFGRPPSMREMIQRYVREEISQVASATGRETFEESDDFEVGDDFDPTSPWELKADQEDYKPPREPSWVAQAKKSGWKPPQGPSWADLAKEAGWQPPSQGQAVNPPAPPADPAPPAGNNAGR